MEKLALIGLIMVLGLSGCACPDTVGSLKQDWVAYWKSLEGDWDSTKQDWAAYWKNREGIDWESLKQDWGAYWKSVEGDWGSTKQDWAAYWENSGCVENQ